MNNEMQARENYRDDVFDHIRDLDFDELTAEEQADFLEHFDVSEYDSVRDTMAECEDFLARAFSEMDVNTEMPVPKAKPLARVINLLQRPIPLYQVGIAASILLIAVFMFGKGQWDGTQRSALPMLADTVHQSATYADSGRFHQDNLLPMGQPANDRVNPDQSSESMQFADTAEHSKAQFPPTLPADASPLLNAEGYRDEGMIARVSPTRGPDRAAQLDGEYLSNSSDPYRSRLS